MRFLREKFLTAHSVQFYGMEGMKLKQKTLREICAETGISRRTLQGYEKLGLTRKGILELMGASDRRKKEVLMELVEQLEAECRQQQELIEQARKSEKIIIAILIIDNVFGFSFVNVGFALYLFVWRKR